MMKVLTPLRHLVWWARKYQRIRPVRRDYALEVPLAYTDKEYAPKVPVTVICHMFHVELAPEILASVRNIRVPVRLFVSTDTEEKKAEIEALLADQPGLVHAEVRVLANRGRDIAPKLVGFADVYDSADIILFLHSKRDRHNLDGNMWRRFLFSNLLGSPEVVESILSIFHTLPEVGMIAAQHLEGLRGSLKWESSLPDATRVGRRLGFSIPRRRAIDFPSGSMFWARAAALRPLLDLKLGLDDFQEEAGQAGGTVAHALERLFFFSCERSGMRWVKVARRELYQEQKTIVTVKSAADLRRVLGKVSFRLL